MLGSLIISVATLASYSHAEIPAIKGTGTPGHIIVTPKGMVAGYWYLDGGAQNQTTIAKPFVWQGGKLYQLPLQNAQYGHVYGGDDRSVVGDIEISAIRLPASWTPDPVKGWAKAKLQVLSKDSGWAVCKDKNGAIYVDAEDTVRVWSNGKIASTTTPKFDLVGVDGKGRWFGNRYKSVGAGNRHLGLTTVIWDGSLWNRVGPKERKGDATFVGVSTKGDAVGNIFDSYDWIVMKWTTAGMVTIDQSFGGGFCSARAMNNIGDVVGTSRDRKGQHAVIWRGTQREDLTNAIKSVNLTEARAVNDKGQIVASSKDNRLFLLTPKA
jgi:uncharacterized membrane protein